MGKNKLLKQAAEKKKELKKDIKENLEGLNWFDDEEESKYLSINDFIGWSNDLNDRLKELKDLEKRIRILKTLN